MLREYISKKIKESEDNVTELEGDIKKNQDKKRELEKLIKILEEENNDGSEIFSPRNHREQNLDKLRHYQEELENVSRETLEKANRLSEVKKKKSEYESMLEEAERNHLEEDVKYSDIDEQIKNEKQSRNREESLHDDRQENKENSAELAEKDSDQSNEVQEDIEAEQNGDEAGSSRMDTKKILERSVAEIVKRIGGEDIQEYERSGQLKTEKSEFAENYDAEQPNEDVSESIEAEEDEAGNNVQKIRDEIEKIEVKSAEVIVLESERKKERDFLEKVKAGIELCYENFGRKNKCKNELRKVKRMIEDYISSIEI